MIFDRKRTWFAYLLWLFGGFFGLHLFYVGRDRQAFVYWITIGGLFGCGWLRDSWQIPTYVAEANAVPEVRKRMIEQRRLNSKPPFSFVRYISQVVVAYVFGLLFYWSVPREEVLGYDLTWLLYLIPMAVSLGVHTVGNIGHQTGSLKAPFVSSVIGAVIAIFLYDSKPSERLIFSCFAASSAFTFKSRQWRNVEDVLDVRVNFFRRVFLLFISACLVFTLIGSGLYFNAEIKDEFGQSRKFRDVAADFVRSPEWQQLKDAARTSYHFYRAHGWRKIIEMIIERLDPDGERRARKVLGVTSNASKEEIVARWRVISKEWHPDRHRDPVEKEEAHQKFMEYQAAYQSLIKIRGKFKATKDSAKFVPNINLEL